MRNGPTGVGYTFEQLLNKEEDNKPIPDFEGIEIKTLKYFSKRKIHLFNATPDGDYLFPIKRVQTKLGYPDKEYPQFKVFCVSLKANEFKSIGSKKIKVQVNREKEKIEVIAYNMFGWKMDINVSWSFELLEKSLITKLQNLAIVKSCYRRIKKEDYFFYTGISFYKLKDFETFLELIEKGIIPITFKIGLHKDPEKFGITHDRGTDFAIMEDDIPLLFNKI